MKYRAEIDGLRALAIIPVVLFHVSEFLLPGGFIGVDIFFVISGYLITSIIINDINLNKFSIINFYERRIRRILPALFSVLFVSIVISFIYLPPQELKDFGQSLFSQSLFISNIYFWYERDYFDLPNNLVPLLHTWSLSVEEQFYLFFPFVLIFFYQKKYFFHSLISIIILTILLSYFTSKTIPVSNFFLLPFRAWELLIGSVAAVLINQYKFTKNINNNFKSLFSFIGLFMVIFSLYIFDKNVNHPGIFTIIPVIGTFFIILFANSSNIIGKILSLKPLVFFGLISYSLYLIHYPVFVFYRVQNYYKATDTSTYIYLIILSVILSFLSFKYIETPFRKKDFINRKLIFNIALFLSLLLFIIGIVIHLNNGFPNRFSKINNLMSLSEKSPYREKCLSPHTGNFRDYTDACRYFGENINVAVYGDSHAVELSWTLAKRLENKNRGIVDLSLSGETPAINYKYDAISNAHSKNVIEGIVNDENINDVVIIFRYSQHLFGANDGGYPLLPDSLLIDEFRKYPNNYNKNKIREEYWLSLLKIINILIENNKNVIIIAPVPELGRHIKYIAYENRNIINNNLNFNIPGISRKYYDDRNEFILNKLESIKNMENLIIIKPTKFFCDTNFCYAFKNGKPMYLDGNHLNLHAFEIVVNEILKYLE